MDAQRTAITQTNPAPESLQRQASPQPTKARWRVLFLISLMYLICYMDRSSISVAAPGISREFGLSRTQMAIVFSVFAWAYAIGQIPGGWLGDRFGPRKILGSIMTWWALAASATGAATGLGFLTGARFLLGLGEAGAFPVATRGLQLWFPKSERGVVSGVAHGCARVAGAITPLIALSILAAFGWRAIFYILGSLGFLWSLGLWVLYRNRPEDHKGVNQAELAHIRGVDARRTSGRPSVPWRTILGSPNVWCLALAYGCFFYGSYFIVSWYPTYLLEYRHLSMKSLGLVASLPLISPIFGELTGGWLTDFLFRKTGRLRWSRRIVCAPALLMSAIFVIPAAMTDSLVIAVICLTASFFFLDMVVGPSWAVSMDVGGQFSGTVASIMNMAGALGGSISPLVFGSFAARDSWVAPFFVTAAVLLTGALIWAFLINPEKSVVDAGA